MTGGPDRLRSAQYARQRREALGLTQADVAMAAGVRDVKTVRNLETGRTWPNDLTRRGIETALRIQLGTLDRLADGAEADASDYFVGQAQVTGQLGLPSAQELIDLSAAISKLSQVHEAMVTRGADGTAERIRILLDAASAVMAGYRPVLQDAAVSLDQRSHGSARPARPVLADGDLVDDER